MIKIVFFARLRELIEESEMSIDINKKIFSDVEHITVTDVLVILKNKKPAFNDYLKHSNPLMIAVNKEVVDETCRLVSGDELALFPPVTGG